MKIIYRFFLLIFTVFMISGCGFFGSSETLEISAINVKTLENGDKEVTILYADEFAEPLVFVVPKGEKGDEGNGIGEVTYTPVEGGTEIEINFTKEGAVPLKFTVSNGISVTGVESVYDKDKEITYVTFVFSDGSKSDTYALPKGEQGVDGVSIIDIVPNVNRDQSVNLTIYLSDGTEKEVKIPAPIQGEDGNGVKNVEIVQLDELGDNFEIKLTLDDDSTISAPINRVNKWFTDSAEPSTSIGIKGDLYYCTTNKTIYVREEKRWIPSIDFDKISNIAYEVIFELNAMEDDDTASMPSGVDPIYYIDHGRYFSSNEEKDPIPVPTSDKYVFAGWYTEKGDKLNLNIHGMFTDLTVIASDLKLYARWVEKE